MTGKKTGAPRRARRGLALRLMQLLAGLFLWGVAITLLVRSELGLGPWDAFHVGLSLQTGMSIGMASIATGFVIVAVTALLRIRPGLATLANMVLIGVFVDLLLPLIPVAPGPALALGYFAAGMALVGVATGAYIGAGFGSGPRDALMLVIRERSGWTVGRARAVLEACVLAAGWAMGGRVGLGTVLFALGVGPVVQWGMRLFGAGDTPDDDVDSPSPVEPCLPRAA